MSINSQLLKLAQVLEKQSGYPHLDKHQAQSEMRTFFRSLDSWASSKGLRTSNPYFGSIPTRGIVEWSGSVTIDSQYSVTLKYEAGTNARRTLLEKERRKLTDIHGYDLSSVKRRLDQELNR